MVNNTLLIDPCRFLASVYGELMEVRDFLAGNLHLQREGAERKKEVNKQTSINRKIMIEKLANR